MADANGYHHPPPQHDPQLSALAQSGATASPSSPSALAPPPPPPPSSHPHPHAHHHPQAAPQEHDFAPADDASGSLGALKRKRPAGDVGNGAGSSAGARSKRSRYISIACNECKRRKIKCNGEVPCQRCGNLSLECIYAPNCCNSNFRDTTEFKTMQQHIYSLHEHLEGLWHTVNHIRGLLAPSDIPIPPPPPRLDLFAYDAESARPPPPPPPPHIDPALGRKASVAPLDHASPPGHAHDHDDQHHPAGHVPAQQSGARYTPTPTATATARDTASQLSYELARASMESMGIASGARAGAASTSPEEAAAAVAAAATAAAAAGNSDGGGGGGAESVDDGAEQSEHQRALAELLRGAQVQMQPEGDRSAEQAHDQSTGDAHKDLQVGTDEAGR